MKFTRFAVFLFVISMIAVPAAYAGQKCPIGQFKHQGQCVKPTPEQSLELLLEGNWDFHKGKISHLKKYATPAAREELSHGQHPYAVILTCSDSRLPPEILFDKGLGEIFVVRVAGNIIGPHELGSIEYALEHLGANLIVVLGHERCGAVHATYGAYPEAVEGNIGSLVEAITPAVAAVVGNNPKPTDPLAQEEQIEECIEKNIEFVAEDMEAQSPIIKEFVEEGKAEIVKAKYYLECGLVSVIGEEE